MKKLRVFTYYLNIQIVRSNESNFAKQERWGIIQNVRIVSLIVFR